MKYLLTLLICFQALSTHAQNESSEDPSLIMADSKLSQSDAYKKALALQSMANELYLSERYEEALVNYNNAAQVLMREKQLEPKLLASLTFNIGLSNLRLGNKEGVDQMSEGLKKALEISKGFEAKTAKFANYLAVEFLLDYEGAKPDSALKYYHIAAIANSKNFNHPDWKSSPNMSTTFSHFEMYRSLLGKAYAYELKYIQTSETEWVDAAYRMILASDKLVNSIRQTPVGYGEEIILNSDIAQAQHYGIRISQQLYEITGDERYAETAFLFFEKTKSNQALFNSNISSESLGIPDSYLEKEKTLSEALINYETLLYNQSETNKADEYKARVEVLKEDLRTHREHIKLKYPEFYAYKYENEYLTIDQTKELLLKEGEVLLSYNLFNSNVYSFKIDKNGFDLQFHQVDSSLQAHILRFSNILKAPNISKEGLSEFKSLSKELSRLIFSDQLDLSQYSKVTILPDGLLNILPFGVLLTNDSSKATTFKDLPYLIKTHNVKYGTSATALARQVSNKPKVNSRVLAIAPLFSPKKVLNPNQFDSTRAAMGNLAYTEVEVGKIGSHFPTTNLLDSMATERAFKKHASDYSVVHIASHAVLDQDNSLFSKLLFSPFDTDSINDGYLNVLEILGMDIQADMVVLSACNTGAGEILEGEGVVGLANGFFYAGAKSLIMTLWTANDESTSILMDDFYYYLSKGQSKDMALRNAKMTYLKSADELLSHPYYWAHFVFKGDDSPLVKKSPSPHYWVLIATLMFIVIVYLFNMKRSVFLHS